MKHIYKYQLANGKIPFDDWFKSLDKAIKAKVLVRIERLRYDLYGSYRSLRKGIKELKFDSGERIYFYEEAKTNTIVLLLNAGKKQRQSTDIKTAEKYLEDYKQRKKRHHQNERIKNYERYND